MSRNDNVERFTRMSSVPKLSETTRTAIIDAFNVEDGSVPDEHQQSFRALRSAADLNRLVLVPMTLDAQPVTALCVLMPVPSSRRSEIPSDAYGGIAVHPIALMLDAEQFPRLRLTTGEAASEPSIRSSKP